MFGTDFNWFTTNQSLRAFSSITSYFGLVLVKRVEHDLPDRAVVGANPGIYSR